MFNTGADSVFAGAGWVRVKSLQMWSGAGRISQIPACVGQALNFADPGREGGFFSTRTGL